jgi:hypothetical protein
LRGGGPSYTLLWPLPLFAHWRIWAKALAAVSYCPAATAAFSPFATRPALRVSLPRLSIPLLYENRKLCYLGLVVEKEGALRGVWRQEKGQGESYLESPQPIEKARFGRIKPSNLSNFIFDYAATSASLSKR